MKKKTAGHIKNQMQSYECFRVSDCMFLECGRKRERLEKTHVNTGRTCKFHTEKATAINGTLNFPSETTLSHNALKRDIVLGHTRLD